MSEDDDFEWRVPPSFNFGRDVVDAIARATPDKLALICSGAAERRFGFADIARLSNCCARALQRRGVRRGERVIVMLPRIAAWQVAMLGCMKLGAIPIPCIEMLTGKDLAYRIAQAGVTAAITTAASAGKLGPAGAAPAVRLAVGAAEGGIDFDAALAAESDADFACADLAIDEPAILYFTSGSTGLPKGVTHATRAIYCWRGSAACWLDLRADDLMWCTADTGWSKAGTSILFGPWSMGSAVLFHDARFDAAERIAMIARHGVTVFCGAATEFRHMVNEDCTSLRGARLRLAVSAGESVNPEVVRRWVEATGVPLIEAYGQTETLMTVGNSLAFPVRPGSMGKPMPGCRMAVLGEDGAPLPRGERGELALRVPHPQLMLGYWNEPQRTAATRSAHGGVEYFRTGDLAHADADGYLYYDGRADDIIGSAGYRIGPTEVENALAEHPAVTECAVVGSPDAERGEVVKAFVVLRPGHAASEALTRELQAHVQRITAPYKYPRRIEYVSELPKTATGKLLRRVLRDAEYAARGAERPG